MGIDASSEEAAARSLREREEEACAREPLAPLGVATAGAAARSAALRAPVPRGSALRFALELRGEDGRVRRRAGRLRCGAGGVRVPLPDAPPGYHELRVRLEWRGGSLEARQRLALCPRRCAAPGERLAGGRALGLWTQLYTLRSRRDWGAGDFGELRRLARIAGRADADFVGLQPLHALWHRGHDVSPYAPTSRLFRSELHLEIEAIPELAASAAAAARLGSRAFRARLAALRAEREVDYDGVHAAKREILRLLHRTFAARHRGRETARGRAYARYRAREGAALDDFAAFVALAEHLEARGIPRDARRWPAPYRDARGAAVAAFRAAHAEAIDFHAWLQFELERQLAGCAAEARRAGLRLGLYQDLAVGSAPGGADPWSHAGLFAAGATLGAPPDAFVPEGQDWGIAPLIPTRLAASGFDFWIRLLRASLARAGALRVDHAMGLVRLYWVPEGRPPAEGAYVLQPARELLGLLALESRRHRSVVVAEDLGILPPGFGALLARYGILSSRVLYLERRGAGFRPARSWPRRALALAHTHDQVPLAGFAEGRDLELRARAGALPAGELAGARTARAAEAAALARRLAREGLLPRGEPLPGPPRLAGAVAAFLRRTPSRLLAMSVDDLAGERDPVNLPGVPPDRHPSWRRKLSVPLEALAREPSFRAAFPRARR
jgi:4-alpha-glucanotransferase